MKILQLTQHYLPYLGGVETHVHEINKRLVKDGFEIDVITQREPNTSDFEVKDQISIHRVPSITPLKLKYGLGTVMPQMFLKMRELEPDVIHAHGYGYFPTWLVLFSNKPFLITTHSDPTAKIYPFFDMLRSIPIRACDQVIATTEMEKNHLLRRGVRKNKIKVIPNGVTLPPIDVQSKNLGCIVLCLARLDTVHKGQDILLRAMPKVLSCISNAKLWLIGEGNDLPKLKELAKKLKIEESVAFKGAIDESTKYYYLKNCSLLCVSPRTESFGIVYLEAMACGLPIVTTRVGGIPEVVGDSALLVPPNDPTALANALIQVLTDRQLAQDLSARGLCQVKNFDWNILTKKYEAVYQEIMRK
jgi:glycosyltransferase involved in cell wall biosynthesis